MSQYLLSYPVIAPFKVIALTLLLAVGCVLGLPKVIVEGNLEAMIDQQDPSLMQLYDIEAEFTESHTVVIGVVAQNSVFTQHAIEAIQAITEASWATPYAHRVDSISNFQYTQAEDDDLIVDNLFPAGIQAGSSEFLTARQVALSLPELKNQLVSADEKMAAIYLNFTLENGGDYDQETALILSSVETMLAPIEAKYPQLDFIISGKIALDRGLHKHITKDSSTLIPLMLLLMIVILYFLLRSVTATFGAIVVVALTGVTTIGLVGWLQIPLDAITSLSPIVIMTLAVADSVHINSGTLAGLNKGLSKKEALQSSLQHNAMPVFLTSLTTVLGVITFVFTDLPTVKSLGIIIAIGVTMAFFFSVTLLPALLCVLPMRPAGSFWQQFSFRPLASFVINHHKLLLVLLGSLFVGMAVLAPKNQVNESTELFFKKSTTEKQGLDVVNQHLAGVTALDFVLYSGKENGITEPEFLQAIEGFNSWLKEQKGVGHVKSIGDTFKQLNKTLHGNNEDWYVPPDSRELAAQYLLLYELSLPMGLDLANQVNLDKSAVRLTINTKYLFAAERLALRDHAIDWFNQHYPDITLVATGRSIIMEAMTVEKLIPDMLQGGVIAMAMVSLVLFVGLRSWSLGLMGMLANIVPVMAGYGIWSLIDGVANIAVMSVAGICLGVVVDFAVHFLSKYREARLHNHTPEEAIHYSFEKVGFPLWATTLVLVSGFLLLLFSSITLNSSLGALTAIIILITLLFDFVVLPAMLLCIDRKQA